MTRSEAIAEQERISNHHNLGWWFGTNCIKCCGVFPRLIVPDEIVGGCYYQCDVCGKRTPEEPMPHFAADDWNAGNVMESALMTFDEVL